MKIGFTELLIVFIVALFVIGPDKIPLYAKKLGEGLAAFRKYSQEATNDIKESIVEPLEEAQQPLREAMEPINETAGEIQKSVKEVQDSFADLTKPLKPDKKAGAAKPEVSAAAAAKEASGPETAAETKSIADGSAVTVETSEPEAGSAESVRTTESSVAEPAGMQQPGAAEAAAENNTGNFTTDKLEESV